MIKYVPILRGKDGEFVALQNLDESVLSKICPLIQFLPDTNKKRKGDYLVKILSGLTSAWNFDGNLIYFDVSYLDELSIILNLAHGLRDFEINFIPVIHPKPSRKYLELLQNEFLGNGICIRIKREFATPDILNKIIDQCINTFQINETEIDILIDLQYIENERDLFIYQNTFSRLLESINNLDEIRRVIIGSGSFPTDVAKFRDNKISSIPRIEWSMWKRVKRELKGFPLIYADYGNVHPIYDPITTQFEGSCTIKYTSDSEFLIFRGIKASRHKEGGKQYHQKSKELIHHASYDGRDFSWGDEYIHRCANYEISSGNAGTWVKYTLNHHFMKVLTQLGFNTAYKRYHLSRHFDTTLLSC